MAEPVRDRRYDMVESDFLTTALSHIVAHRRRIGLAEERRKETEANRCCQFGEERDNSKGSKAADRYFLNVYTQNWGPDGINREAIYPESLVPLYRLERFRQLNNVDLTKDGKHMIYGWVFLRYGDNPLRKLKIQVTYHVDNGQIALPSSAEHAIIADSCKDGFNSTDYVELQEIESDAELDKFP
ncbi:MAG: hypothetical protein WC536_04625 [Patescibacteria group bacterium]